MGFAESRREVPVGRKLFVSRGVAGSAETGFFRPLDLGHAPIVNDELDDAITEAFDFFTNERDPVRKRGVGSGSRTGKR